MWQRQQQRQKPTGAQPAWEAQSPAATGGAGAKGAKGGRLQQQRELRDFIALRRAALGKVGVWCLMTMICVLYGDTIE